PRDPPQPRRGNPHGGRPKRAHTTEEWRRPPPSSAHGRSARQRAPASFAYGRSARWRAPTSSSNGDEGRGPDEHRAWLPTLPQWISGRSSPSPSSSSGLPTAGPAAARADLALRREGSRPTSTLLPIHHHSILPSAYFHDFYREQADCTPAASAGSRGGVLDERRPARSGGPKVVPGKRPPGGAAARGWLPRRAVGRWSGDAGRAVRGHRLATGAAEQVSLVDESSSCGGAEEQIVLPSSCRDSLASQW
ncbi:unnamed protein product, partial [Urochloa humidicola]